MSPSRHDVASHGGDSDARSRIGLWLCLAGALIGVHDLIAWLTGTSSLLTSLAPGLPRMMPSTALALTLIGSAAAVRHNGKSGRTRYVLPVLAAVMVLAIGESTLLEHVTTMQAYLVGATQTLVPSLPVIPEPPSPRTALALLCLAGAFLLLDVRPAASARPSEVLALGAALTAFTGLIGIVIGAAPLYRSVDVPTVGFSLATTIGLLLISAGLVHGLARGGAMRAAASPGPGGRMLRRLGVPVLLMPLVLGLLVTRVARAEGLDGSAVPVAFLVAAMALVNIGLLLANAVSLNRAHDDLQATHRRISESEERFRLALDAAPIGMAIGDLEGSFVRVNRALCDIVGYSAEELTGLNFRDITHPDDLASGVALFEQLRRGEIPRIQIEKRYIRKDGASVDVMMSLALMRERSGQPLYFIGQAEDITVRKRLADDMRLSENEQRLFADVGSALAATLEHEETAARVAAAVVQGFADLCIVDLVDRAGEIRRISVVSSDRANDAICKVLRRIPAGEPRPSLVEWVLEWREASVIQRVSAADIEGLSYGGQQRRALTSLGVRSFMILPLVARGQLVGALTFLSTSDGFLEPRADLRIAQELAHLTALGIDNSRLYREAQRATQARDEMLGIVAHDLRNPLSMVLMEARLLSNSNYTPDRRSAQPGERIHRAAMRMSRLIQDLLDITRLEAGAFTIDRAPEPAAQIATDAVELQRALVALMSVEIQVELSSGLPLIAADRDRLLQVFENLIGNAIKFTPAQGVITVGASSNGSNVCFWVGDTGPGIPEEEQTHLFDRFWQARTAARHGGAGLGLPIVKGIVEAHGGHLWVESALGRGSTFFFTVPVVAAPVRESGGLGKGSSAVR